MSITRHVDIYYTNKHYKRFGSEEEAIKDELRRDHIPYQIKVIGVPQDQWQDSYAAINGDPIVAIDDSKSPYTDQPDGTCKVYLFKPIIARMQRLVDKHGDNLGWTNHHCGMGMHSTELCLLLPNPKVEDQT